MRVKLDISPPLVKQACWFAITEKGTRQTVDHLRKKIVHDLELNVEPSLVKLSMDGFNFLPQTRIQDLIRDGDLISVKSETTAEKRKLVTVQGQEHDTETSPIKKPKLITTKKGKKSSEKQNSSKKKKHIEKTKSSEKEKPIEKIKSSKEKKTSRKKEGKVASEEKTSKKSKKSNTLEIIEKTPIKKRTAPFEGAHKTKQRNMRRRLLKQHLKANASAEVNDIETIPESTSAQLTVVEPVSDSTSTHLVESLSITAEEPLQLIKKNKNKKKNHLKQMDLRSHILYTPPVIESTPAPILPPTPPVQTPSNQNLHGRAFVTFIESDPKYKGRNNTSKYPPRQYPINQVSTLFYAEPDPETTKVPEQPVTQLEIEQVPEQPVVSQVEKKTNKKTAEPEKVNEPELPVDYESFPEADFKSNIPSVGSTLAIKTLELTASYTPEISDWKQVILKEFNKEAEQVTFEYLPGFGKATTKGGKFDIKKKKKRYDDWYQEEYYEEEEEEVEEEEASLATFAVSDIFALRNMS